MKNIAKKTNVFYAIWDLIDKYMKKLVFSSENYFIKSENKIMGKKWLVFSLIPNSSLSLGNVQTRLVLEHPNGKSEEGEIKIDFGKTVNAQPKIIEYRLKEDSSSILNKQETVKCSLFARKKIKYDWVLIQEFHVNY